MEHIKISIIIPSYNQGEFIERTINSVLNQLYSNIELIVIDGGSTDTTIDIIKKYQANITYYVSEKDSGQSHAINKGFRIATGDFITWLNSDDVLLPKVLHKLAKAIQENNATDWFLGNIIWIDKNDKILKLRKGERYNQFLANNYYAYAYGPTTFFRKELLLKYGFLREDMHYMMDTELWYRFMKNKVRFKRLNFYCWGLRLHENAKMSGHNFSSSPMSNADHPSFKKKQAEREIIENEYLIRRKSGFIKYIFLLFKLSHFSFYSALTKSFLFRNKYYYEVFKV